MPARQLNYNPTAGKRIFGTWRSGTPYASIPQTGEDYGSILANDAGSGELRAYILTQPSLGNVTLEEDGSGVYTGDYSTPDSFTYRLYTAGVSGSTYTVTLDYTGAVASMGAATATVTALGVGAIGATGMGASQVTVTALAEGNAVIASQGYATISTQVTGISLNSPFAQTSIVSSGGLPVADTVIVWTWFPDGAPGYVTSYINGISTTDSNGQLIVFVPAGAGMLEASDAQTGVKLWNERLTAI